jgi:hypothetical protein
MHRSWQREARQLTAPGAAPFSAEGRRQQPRPHQHVVEVRQERRYWSSGSLAGRER